MPRNFSARERRIAIILIACCATALGQEERIVERIPSEVRHKTGYINRVPIPENFKSALLWGIAIADTRVMGFESATVSVAWTQLACSVNGRLVILNEDWGEVRGGLYRRFPWFGTDVHETLPVLSSLENDPTSSALTLLRVGQRPDRAWHFWSPSPRAELPSGGLAGCTVRALVKISRGALLQIGMDYWRDTHAGYGIGNNNHEAGASNWYFPSDEWQEAVFSDIHQD